MTMLSIEVMIKGLALIPEMLPVGIDVLLVFITTRFALMRMNLSIIYSGRRSNNATR